MLQCVRLSEGLGGTFIRHHGGDMMHLLALQSVLKAALSQAPRLNRPPQ